MRRNSKGYRRPWDVTEGARIAQVSVDWKQIEAKWQSRWKSARIFEADPHPNKPKFYLTVAYPYPSSPQHIGHSRTYALADAYARYMRMKGFNVLFPMAFHYTGTPVLAFARRIARGDAEVIDDFKKLYHVPEDAIKKFTDPLEIAIYFHEEMKEGMNEMGYSIDWRREFTTIDPGYNRFIEWQFRKLKAGGYIRQGTHPVGWCPMDRNPMGQHDTEGDVEPEIVEFTGIKFVFGDAYLPTATLRPETIFGVTNIWVNPSAEYRRVKVKGESWIVSERAAERLLHQFNDLKVMDRVDVDRLVGAEALNPVVDSQIPILPAQFVNPRTGTGIVMSVPAHAPYDYQALNDLKAKPDSLRPYGISFEYLVKRLEPITVIECEGYSSPPAKSAIERYGIQGQMDAKLEEATSVLYSDEFHRGVMMSNTGPYAGQPVREVRGRLASDLISAGKATRIFELQNAPVYCRCGAEVVVKVLEDQWFIDYANPEWKQRTREALLRMSILPEAFRPSFEYTIGWLKEKACARSSGLGTHLPWDPDWIIESLSDSTIYMAYYIISKFINQGLVRAEQLNDAFFDCIFLGACDVSEASKSTGIPEEVIRGVREEFEYFYPLDSRHSGLDLITNHLTFFIFNHVAIFPPRLWPKQIVANGLVLMEGQKMSKSLANIIPLRDGVRSFGADPVRLTVLATADLMVDADISLSKTREFSFKLQKMYDQCLGIGKPQVTPEKLELEDRWLLSRLQNHVEIATAAMDKMELREAALHAFFMLDHDIDWYLRFTASRGRSRGDPAVLYVLHEVFSARVKMMAPITPHICEEIWEKLGNEDFLALASWPTVDIAKRDDHAELSVEFLERVLEDARNILKVTKLEAKRIVFYISAPWKVSTHRMLLDALAQGREPREAIRIGVEALPPIVDRKAGVETVKKIVEMILDTSPEGRARQVSVSRFDEAQVLEHASAYIKDVLGVKEIKVYQELDPLKYDPRDRAKQALPFKPALYIE